MIWTFAAVAAQAIFRTLLRGDTFLIPQKWHRGCCRLAGVRVTMHGEPQTERPVLFVSNHVSYLDIVVLGSLVRASFVAKSEVADWPVLGWLSKIQNTVFIRRRRHAASGQRDELKTRLAQGDSLILFPEGTSGCGNHTLQFKSALFGVVEGDDPQLPFPVQPVSVVYTKFGGLPMDRAHRPFVAWYGDMELAPHLWRLLGLGEISVDVIFHNPLTINDFPSRKALSSYCGRVVAEGVSVARAGRLSEMPAAENAQDGVQPEFG